MPAPQFKTASIRELHTQIGAMVQAVYASDIDKTVAEGLKTNELLAKIDEKLATLTFGSID